MMAYHAVLNLHFGRDPRDKTGVGKSDDPGMDEIQNADKKSEGQGMEMRPATQRVADNEKVDQAGQMKEGEGRVSSPDMHKSMPNTTTLGIAGLGSIQKVIPAAKDDDGSPLSPQSPLRKRSSRQDQGSVWMIQARATPLWPLRSPRDQGGKRGKFLAQMPSMKEKTNLVKLRKEEVELDHHRYGQE
jgi:hypothetical protein